MCSKLIGHKVKRNDPARDRDMAMVGLLLLFCQGAETSLRTGTGLVAIAAHHGVDLL